MKTPTIDLSAIPPDVCLTPEDAAAIMSVSVSTLDSWRWKGRGRLKYVKLGHAVRYRAGDLREWIASRVQEHTGEAA